MIDGNSGFRPPDSRQKPVPKRRRGLQKKPSKVGLCQICGRRLMVTARDNVIRTHGFNRFAALRMPCPGSGHPAYDKRRRETSKVLPRQLRERAVADRIALEERVALIDAGKARAIPLRGSDLLKLHSGIPLPEGVEAAEALEVRQMRRRLVDLQEKIKRYTSIEERGAPEVEQEERYGRRIPHQGDTFEAGGIWWVIVAEEKMKGCRGGAQPILVCESMTALKSRKRFNRAQITRLLRDAPPVPLGAPLATGLPAIDPGLRPGYGPIVREAPQTEEPELASPMPKKKPVPDF